MNTNQHITTKLIVLAIFTEVLIFLASHSPWVLLGWIVGIAQVVVILLVDWYYDYQARAVERQQAIDRYTKILLETDHPQKGILNERTQSIEWAREAARQYVDRQRRL